jgi:hypothetical protein
MEDITMTTPSKSTLLDLVQAVSVYATSDEEIVAAVAYLINSGRVLLCGTFAGARIDLWAVEQGTRTGEKSSKCSRSSGNAWQSPAAVSKRCPHPPRGTKHKHETEC